MQMIFVMRILSSRIGIDYRSNKCKSEVITVLHKGWAGAHLKGFSALIMDGMFTARCKCCTTRSCCETQAKGPVNKSPQFRGPFFIQMLQLSLHTFSVPEFDLSFVFRFNTVRQVIACNIYGQMQMARPSKRE